jgi:hypothetical protein
VRARWRPLGRLVHAAGRGDAVSRHELLSVRGRTVAWVFPLLLLIGIAAGDVTTGAFEIISWTVLVPGVAAAICGVRGTAVFAVLAVVVYVMADTVWQHRAETGLPGLVLVVLGGAIAVVAAGYRVDGERRMLHMRDIADTTRRTVLRPLPAGFGGIDHAAVYLSADSEARVGGDFYDIQPGPHGTRVLVGDVQGKGLGAVEAAAALLGTFREAAYHEADLGTVAERLEIRILRHRAHTAALGRSDGDRFATAVLIGFSPGLPDAVDAVVFGHEPPLAVGPRGVRAVAQYADLRRPVREDATGAPAAPGRGRDAAAGHRRGDRGPRPLRGLLPAGRRHRPRRRRRRTRRRARAAGGPRTGRHAAALPGAGGRRHHGLRGTAHAGRPGAGRRRLSAPPCGRSGYRAAVRDRQGEGTCPEPCCCSRRRPWAGGAWWTRPPCSPCSPPCRPPCWPGRTPRTSSNSPTRSSRRPS